MNTIRLLLEKHSFRSGDNVRINFRNKPEEKYYGTIYTIVNNYDRYFKMNIDYFYISFNKDVYNKILQRGWKVIYNGEEHTLGDMERNIFGEIKKIYIQYDYIRSYEKEIKLEDIYGILIWREGYNIEKI
jgi:hypothetical protein